MKFLKLSVFILAMLVSAISMNAVGQVHEHDQMEKQEMPKMMMIGKGEMKYTCSMPEHKVFSATPGKCPECGMNLKEMTEDDIKKMHEMMKTHQHIDEKGKMTGTMGYIEHKAGGKTMLMIGEGEMTHMSPMPEHKAFATKAGKCPVCGMMLKEMTDENKKKMHQMMETHQAVNINGAMIMMGEPEKHDPAKMTMLMIGEGEMKYTCSMPEHKVFSATPGKCPVCGMNLKEMTEEDIKRMETLKKDHKVIKHEKK